MARAAVGETPLDLCVGPRANAGLRVRRDVGGHRRSPRAGEDVAALAEGVLVTLNAVWPSPVAFHAVGDRGEIEPPRDRIAQRLVRVRLHGAGNELGVHP